MSDAHSVPPNSGGKKPNFLFIIAIVFVLMTVGAGVKALMDTGNSQGYAPTQPIPFSHKLHAGQNNIPCMYCHVGVEKSKHAIVPSMNICMNCHAVVKTDSPHIKKLKEYYDQGKPIPWVKVHDMPDFVYFAHKRHVAKGIACETCHGDVKKMDVVRQDQRMSMGWCLDCHRGRTAPEFLQRAPENTPKDAAVPAGGVAPVSCYTCHH